MKTGPWAVAIAALLALESMTPAQNIKGTRDIAVIVSPQNPVSDISLADLRKVFRAEKRTWSGKLQVSLVIRGAPSHERDIALGKLMQLDETEYRPYWEKLVYAGELPSEPLEVPSNGMAMEFVAAHPGAVALVPGYGTRPDLKVLKLNGLLPGDPNYPLR